MRGRNLAMDVRHAWRSLRHSPSFAVVALLTLTSGIGLSTAVFSLVSGILTQPLPYPYPDRLVRLAEFRQPGYESATGGRLADTTIGLWLERRQVIEALAPYSTDGVTVTTPSGAQNVVTARVGPAFFQIVDVGAAAGRLLQPFDFADNATPVAVVSDALWASAFGRSHDAIGRTLVVDQQTRVIVGVVPRRLSFPATDVDVWIPGTWKWPPPGRQRMFQANLETIARLRDGASLEDAAREGASIALAIATADPAFADGEVEVSRIRVRRLLDDLVAPVRPALLTLGAGMALVLIAACVSLANLLLVRHTARQREFAVRLALGASRRRIAGPLLIEQVILAGAGGLVGAGLAWWILRALPAVAPADLPRLENVRFDGGSLAFVTLTSFVTAVLVGLLPVWQMPGADFRELAAPGRVRLWRSTRSAEHLRAVLVAGQVALAVVLLVGAMLIGRSLAALLKVDPGYQPDGVLTFQVSFPPDVLRREGFLRRYYTELLDRIRRHPSVVSAGYAMALPLRQVGLRGSVNIVGRPVKPPASRSDMAIKQTIDGEYLRTVGTRVLGGRTFTPQDTTASQKVVLVDEVLARKYFPNEDPIGRQLLGPRAEPWTIVGIVEAVHAGGLAAAADPVVYSYAPQLPDALAYFPTGAGIAVRVSGDPLDLAPFVRGQARQVDATLPLYNISRLSDQLSGTIAHPRFFAIVLGLFAALALSTALLGIYGVLAYAVERRRLEFGIRRALGATERDVALLVMRRGLVLALVGVAIGLPGGAFAARFMRALLFGVQPADPFSFGGAAALVVAVVLGVSWHPMRRAARLDPASALRVE